MRRSARPSALVRSSRLAAALGSAAGSGRPVTMNLSSDVLLAGAGAGAPARFHRYGVERPGRYACGAGLPVLGPGCAGLKVRPFGLGSLSAGRSSSVRQSKRLIIAVSPVQVRPPLRSQSGETPGGGAFALASPAVTLKARPRK